MSTARRLFQLGLGARPARVDGVATVEGLRGPVRIRRDGWSVPHIEAEHDADAFLGLGFCQGQDRAFQIETYKRVANGTLAALIGEDGVAIDRLTRRLGLRRRAVEQLDDLRPDLRLRVEAFAAGITAGMRAGSPAHEFTLLRSAPSEHSDIDVIATLKLQSFLLAGNWQEELMRLKVLTSDGVEALRALDPRTPEHLAATSPVGAAVGRLVDRLGADLDRLAEYVAVGGASNNWALSGERTASGRPIVANDPHLPPSLPAAWYLASLRTPAWHLAGAAFAGTPGVAAGHNGAVAWGVTAGLADDTDLFLEDLLPGGGEDWRAVRGPDGPVRCPVRREVIEVAGGDAVVEEVVETPRGPLVGDALDGLDGVGRDGPLGLSISGIWLGTGEVEGLLDAAGARSFEELRQRFAHWPGMSLNLVGADAGGSIGWQLVGELPVRRSGTGVLPLPGWLEDVGWTGAHVPFAAMPSESDPEAGFVATANNTPVAEGRHPFLGSDFLDGYRATAIRDALAARDDWDLAGTAELQRDVRSIPWEEVRRTVLAVPPAGSRDAELALRLLGDWDGRVAVDSAGAAVFELALAALVRRVARAKAPRSAEAVLGASSARPLLPHSIVGLKRTAHLVELLRTRPDGWFDEGWDVVLREVLAEAVAELRRHRGDRVRDWGWGEVRTLTFRHAVGRAVPALAAVFDRGPYPCAGDASTIPQASVPPLDPLGDPVAIASLRMVVDVGDWSASRWVLAGGQSGNPVSPHYDDQLQLWLRGEAIPIPWTQSEVRAAAETDLRLLPAYRGGPPTQEQP